jgi:hypothetical protein
MVSVAASGGPPTCVVALPATLAELRAACRLAGPRARLLPQSTRQAAVIADPGHVARDLDALVALGVCCE